MGRFVCHCIILAITVLATYYNSLDCQFVFDDMSAIVENKDLRPETPVWNLFLNDFWGTPMNKEKSHKSYRPLCVLTFRLNYILSELNPMTYHLTNVLLHASVCILFLRVCKMFLNEQSSFVAAMLFSVHPIHTEAVTGVVGRAECLSTIFFLAAFLTYTKCTGYRKSVGWMPLACTVALVAVAMLCKEQGITILGVCCVFEMFVAQRASFKQLLIVAVSIVRCKPQIPSWLWTSIIRSSFLVLSTMFLLLARVKVMGAQLPVFTRFDNPASVSPAPVRHMTYSFLLPVNAWLLLFPMDLCCDWTMGTIPLITSVFDLRNAATLVFILTVSLLTVFALSAQTSDRRATIMGLSLMVLPFIPASNLFFPVGFVVAERILYAPSLGFCMLVALGYETITSQSGQYRSLRTIVNVFITILLVSHGTRTFIRNYDWRDEYRIFRSALKTNRNNAKLWNNVGHTLEKVEKFTEALSYFEKAAIIQPDDIGAHINVGRTYNNLNISLSAERAFRRAIDLFPPVIKGKSYTARVAPNHLNAYLNLANLVSNNPHRLDEARRLLQHAIAMRSDYIEAYINLGDIFVKLGREVDARRTYEAAIEIDPGNADLYFNLGVIWLEQEQSNKALFYFNRALECNPDHKQSLYNSAMLLQDTGHPPDHRQEALKRLEKLQLRDPFDPKIYFNMAMMSMDDGDFASAEVNFKKAVEASGGITVFHVERANGFSSISGTKYNPSPHVLHIDCPMPPFMMGIIHLDPAFRSALFNMALMLVNDLRRPSDAIPFLKQLLQHYPNHTKGLILMGDLNVNLLKDLDAAEQNFLKILSHEPADVQANHNLCVVYLERGDLLQAEKCLVSTLSLDPQAHYVRNHLSIVRSRINQIRLRHEQGHQTHDDVT